MCGSNKGEITVGAVVIICVWLSYMFDGSEFTLKELLGQALFFKFWFIVYRKSVPHNFCTICSGMGGVGLTNEATKIRK